MQKEKVIRSRKCYYCKSWIKPVKENFYLDNTGEIVVVCFKCMNEGYD